MRKQAIIFFLLLFIDQLLKYIFSFGYEAVIFQNKLISFSFSTENKILGWLPTNGFWLLVLVLIYFAIIVYIYRDKEFRNRSGLALVFLLAGMSGNLIDRIFFGYVRDYINIGELSFNLADVMIIGGAVVLMTKLKYKNFITHNS